MKLFLLAFASIFTLGTAISQITITAADFASPGDTVMMSSSDETTLNLVTTGANASWDFSLINISAQTIDTFFDVSDADWTYQFMFNNSWDNPDHMSDYYRPWLGIDFSQAAQFGVDVSSPVLFTDIDSDSNEVQNTGIGMYVNGYSIPAKSDTMDIHYELPINYGDSWMSNSYTNVDLNPAFNGIFRRYQQRNTIVDGWGQITTPFGTFDAIRVKSLITVQDSVYIDLGGLGGSWYEMPTPDQVEYFWFTNNQKTPIFQVITQDVGGNETVTSVKFKDKKRYFASVADNKVFSTEIYPNPATDQLNLKFSNPTELVEIRDISGKLVYSNATLISTITKIDVSNWDAGVYIITATQDDQRFSEKIVIE